MPHARALWHRCWREACEAHPDVPARHMAIDACALHMITDPWQFDVIVTENCFGDILSDIAGAGTANPVAAILSCALMLSHLGFAAESAALEAATAGAVPAGECTPDGGGSLSTGQAAAAIARRLG
jgi:3-isopropylmalate dehydrogenase